MMLMPMESHDEKCHVASPFDHHDVALGMVPLMTLLVSHDTDTSLNGNT